MQTVRFGKVVKDSGSPEIYLLWKEPSKDVTLRKLVAQHRVMTLMQPRAGSKKDWGEVGLGKNLEGQVLVFPRSLKILEGKRVVGIDYQLMKEASIAPGRPLKKPAARAKSPPTTRRNTAHRDAKSDGKEGNEAPAKNIIHLPPQPGPEKRRAPEKVSGPVRKSAPRLKKAKVRAAPTSAALVRRKAKAALTAWKKGNQLPAYELIQRLTEES